MTRHPFLIFAGSGWGAPDTRTGQGPVMLAKRLTPFLERAKISYRCLNYHENDRYPVYKKIPKDQLNFHCSQVTQVVTDLSVLVKDIMEQGFFPIVIGGDHSIAIGTWTGVGLGAPNRDFGLLWLDAHMDAHTFETTSTGAPHGMPVGALLGFGYEAWVNLGNYAPKIHPDRLAQIAIRSFERGEAQTLKENNVRIYYENHVTHHGFDFIYADAKNHVTKATPYFGISIDIDAFDPLFAPGTGTREPKGLNPHDVLPYLTGIVADPYCLALEIAEFNALKDDPDEKTFNLIRDLIWVVTNLDQG
jgi:arginase